MEQLKAFFDKANMDPELMAKIEALGEKNEQLDKVIALAAEYGFTITIEEIEQFKHNTDVQDGSNELSEEQLKNVAGGASKDRYCPEWCKNLKEHRWACFVPFVDCDHFYKSNGYTSKGEIGHFYSCRKGAFPDYIGDRNGKFIELYNPKIP